MLEEVLVKLPVSFWGEVIDLARHHEEQRKEVDGNKSKEKPFDGQPMEENRQNVQHKDVKGPSESEGISVQVVAIAKGYHSIVGWLRQSLRDPMHYQAQWNSNKPSKEKGDGLESMGRFMSNVI